MGYMKPKPLPRQFGNYQEQREWEEAVELDRILEEERRQQSMQVFQNNTDMHYDRYLESLQNDGQRLKNSSSGVLGAFGMADTGSDGMMNYRGGQNPYFPKLV